MCTCPKAILDWTYILFICVQCLNPTINIAITKPALFINFICCSQMRLCVKELWLNNASTLIPADYVSSPHGRSSLSTQRSILYVHCTMSFCRLHHNKATHSKDYRSHPPVLYFDPEAYIVYGNYSL